MAAATFGESYEIPEQRAFTKVDASYLDQFTGVYSFGPGFNVYVSSSSGRLLARANQGGYSEFTPVNESQWFSRMLYVNVRFGLDENGAVDRLIWGLDDSAPVGGRKQ